MRGKAADPLFDAVRSNNVAAIKKLVSSGHPINKLDEDKRTALHIALSRPLSSPASEQSASSRLDEKTQSQFAASIKQQEEVVRTLVKLGADPELRDRNGWTPLHAAAQFAPFGLVLYFVEECCRDVNEINKDGTTALHYLARRQVFDAEREERGGEREREREKERATYVEVLLAMAAKGADVDSVTYIGEAPLHQAALKGNTIAAEFLLSFGADLHILSKRGDTPLHYAVMSGHVSIAKYLISMGADVSVLSTLGPIEALAPSDDMRSVLSGHVTAGERRCGGRGGKDKRVTVRVLRGENILFMDTICVVKYGGESKKTDVLRTGESRQTITWDCDLDFVFHPHVTSILMYVTRKNNKWPMGMAVVNFDGAIRNEADGWYDFTSTLLGSEEKTVLFRVKIAVTLCDGGETSRESGIVIASPRLKEDIGDNSQNWKITPKHLSGIERNMSLGVVGRTMTAPMEKEREKEKSDTENEEGGDVKEGEKGEREGGGRERVADKPSEEINRGEREKSKENVTQDVTKDSDVNAEENAGQRTPPIPISPRPSSESERSNKALSKSSIQKMGSGFRVLKREHKITISGAIPAPSLPSPASVSPRSLSRCNTDVFESASPRKAIVTSSSLASSAVSLHTHSPLLSESESASVESSFFSSSSSSFSSSPSLSLTSSSFSSLSSSPSLSHPSSSHSPSATHPSSSSSFASSFDSSLSSLSRPSPSSSEASLNLKPSSSSPLPSSSPSLSSSLVTSALVSPLSPRSIPKESPSGNLRVHVSRVGSIRIDPNMVKSSPNPPVSPTFLPPSPHSSLSLSPLPFSSVRRPLPPVPSRPLIFTPRMSLSMKSHAGVTKNQESDIYVNVEDEDEEVEMVMGENEEEERVDDVAEEGEEEGEEEREEREERGEVSESPKVTSTSESHTPSSPLLSSSTPSPSPSLPPTTSNPTPPHTNETPKESSHDRDEDDQWKKSKVTADDLRKYLQDASQSTPVRWEIDHDEISIMQKIAEGTSGKVLRGVYRYQDVAVKILKKKMDARQAQDFVEEFSILATLRSPFVVYFYGICLEPEMALVMEYCSNGSVYEVLNRKNLVFDWALFMRMAEDMCRGLLSLHSWVPQIVHRDVKSLNFLVDANWVTKVSDFGLSRHSSQSNRDTLGKVRGTFAYSPPEVYTGEPHTAKSDVYSLSIVLWELVHRIITGKFSAPYKEYEYITFDFQILLQSTKGLRPTIPPQCPENVKNVITMCWHPEPECRPESRELLFVVQALRKEFLDEKRLWQSLVKDLSDVPNSHTDASLPTMIARRERDVLVAETVQDSSTGQAVVTIKKGVSGTQIGAGRKEGEPIAVGAPPRSQGAMVKTSPNRSILSPPKGLKPGVLGSSSSHNTSNDNVSVTRKPTLHGVTSVTSMSALTASASISPHFELSMDGNGAKEEAGVVDKKRVRRSISAKANTSRFRPPSHLRSRDANKSGHEGDGDG